MPTWSVIGSRLIAGLLIASCFVSGCARRDAPQVPDVSSTSANVKGNAKPPIEHEPPPGPLRFTDVAQSLGLRFRHHSPLSPERHIHLFMGSGIGWLDMDRDGWPDLYCCQGASYPTVEPRSDDPTTDRPSNALLQNHAGKALVDVTQLAGLANHDYSMGIATADYDNDGFVDLCVTGLGRNFLYHNNGDGSFTRVALPLQDQPGRLSASCVWTDIDGDGNLDLFITNYAKLGPADYPTCEHTSVGITIPISCHPAQLEAMHDLLYRNAGDGTFVEVSEEAGMRRAPPRAGLGVVAADLDSDGDIDLYVANDTTENQLWENQGQGDFVDRGAASGTSRNRHGENEAGMGLVAGDLTGRGRIDLFVTNYYGETNTLYRNDDHLRFTDVTDEMGLGAPSRLRLGFGTSLADFDNDGWRDLLIANGHVQDRLPEVHRHEPFAQVPLLFHHEQRARFRDVAAGAGEYLRTPHVARGTAVADFDRDGRADVAINSLNDAAAILRNDSNDRAMWLRIELIGRDSNRDGVGTLLRVDLPDHSLVHAVQAGTGYLSSDESTILIGMGNHAVAQRVTATWPSGRRETWKSLGANRLWRLIEGTGEEADTAP